MTRPGAVFKNLPYKYKLIISYTILIIIPILLLGTYSYIESRNNLKTQTKMRLENMLHQSALKLDAKVQRYDAAFDSLVIDNRIQQLFAEDHGNMYEIYLLVDTGFNPAVQTITYHHPEIESITFYNVNNVPQYGSMIKPLEPVSAVHWIKNAESSTRWYVKDNTFFGVRKLNNIYATKDLGVLRMEFNYRDTFSNVVEPDMGKYFAVISMNSEILYRENRLDSPEPASPLAAGNSWKDGNILTDIHGTQYLAISARLPAAGWELRYFTPYQTVVSGANNILKVTILIITSCLALLAVLIWIFTKIFVEPILNLNSHMKAVENGDFTLSITSDSADEIGQLINRFGSMVAKINSLINEVYRNKIIRREAEIKALQAQINPHFLYNTLSMINWKAKLKRADEIGEIVNAVTKYYRTSLSKGRDIIPIRDEIENIKSYLKIQQIMHDNGFTIRCRIQEEIYRYSTLKLLLQPLVENAVLHGLDKRKSSPKILEIEGWRQNDAILFRITDNGPGIPPEKTVFNANVRPEGYGLHNVHERIVHFFGEQYGISFDKNLSTGTSVRVMIPVFTEETERCLAAETAEQNLETP